MRILTGLYFACLSSQMDYRRLPNPSYTNYSTLPSPSPTISNKRSNNLSQCFSAPIHQRVSATTMGNPQTKSLEFHPPRPNAEVPTSPLLPRPSWAHPTSWVQIFYESEPNISNRLTQCYPASTTSPTWYSLSYYNYLHHIFHFDYRRIPLFPTISTVLLSHPLDITTYCQHTTSPRVKIEKVALHFLWQWGSVSSSVSYQRRLPTNISSPTHLQIHPITRPSTTQFIQPHPYDLTQPALNS